MKHLRKYCAGLILIFLTNITFTVNIESKEKALGKNSWVKSTAISISAFDIDYDGKIYVSNDDKSITSISPGGFLKISKATFGNSRRIIVESDHNGNLEYKYFEGKSELPFDPEGKLWLADILPDVIRSTGIAAEQRVKRIYKQDGIDGLLDEIEQLETHSEGYHYYSKFLVVEGMQASGVHVRNLYLTITVDQLKLNNSEIQQLLPHIAEIRSNSTKGTLLREILYNYNLTNQTLTTLLEAARTLDYNTERGSILRVLNPELPENDEVTDIYFDIIREMEINSEKGNVIKHLLEQKRLSDETMIKLLKALSDFSSEREKGAVLLKTINYLGDNKELINTFNEVLDEMQKEYYVLKGEIINTLAEKKLWSRTHNTDPKQEILIQLLKSSEDIISSSQKGMILRKINKMFLDNPVVSDKYFEVLQSISSELEAYNVVLDLISRKKLSNHSLMLTLEYAEDLVESDYQHAAGAIIRKLLEQITYDETIIEALFDVVNEMDQNGTIEEILRLISQNEKLITNNKVLVNVIESTEIISVDIEKCSVLLDVKDVVIKSDENLKYIYRNTAKSIESNYFREKALLAVE